MSKEILHSKDEILSFLGGIIPEGTQSLRTFKHRSGVEIVVSRGGPERLDEPAPLVVSLGKGFGRPRYLDKRPIRPVAVEETYYFEPELDRVRRHDIVRVESLTGTNTHELYELREERDGPGVRNIDLNDKDSWGYRSMSKLVDLIQESTRVHPYTGEQLPFDKETEIDKQISAAMKAIDNAGRQVGGALREGFTYISSEPRLDEEGNLHIDVNPKE